LPERKPYTYSEPNSDTYRIAYFYTCADGNAGCYANGDANSFGYRYGQHDADTDDNANSQPDDYAERYTEANSNAKISSDTKGTSDSAGLMVPSY
jgi:hypothetical protein